jgi:threonine aldolase
MRYIDLRSDTVTRPSPEMRKAIAEAEVGDDVFGDDPTVIRLEKKVADLFGKDASLFVPSGTMGNQVALKTLSEPGWELLCERDCHVVNYEVSGPACILRCLSI